MRYVHLDVRFPPGERHPMHAFLDEGDDWRTEMLSWNLTDPETFAVLFRVHAPEAPYLAALEEVGSIEEYSVARLADGSFYLHVNDTPRGADLALRAAFTATDVVAVPPLTFRSGGRLSLGVIGSPAELRTALDSLPGAIDYDVSRVGAYRGGEPAAAAGLTDRQHEALRAALAAGYYAVPREGSVDDVADALGCARSTASTHLRKAEAALVDAYLG